MEHISDLILKDYEKYMDEKKSLIEKLKGDDNILFLKIDHLIKALDHILNKSKTDKISPAEFDLFGLGFEYLNDYFLTISNYTEDQILNKSLIIELLIDLEDYQADNPEEDISDLVSELEKCFDSQLTDSLFEKIDNLLKNENYFSILEAFEVYIDEEL